MNKYLILALALIATSCAPEAQSGYTISGNLAGLSGTVYLSVYEGKLPVAIDSTEAQNGSFTFTGDRKMPIYAAVGTSGGPAVRFFLENAPITLYGSVEEPQNIGISGSPTTDRYLAYKQEMDSVQRRIYIDSLAVGNHRAEDSMMRLVVARKMEYIRAYPHSVASAYVLFRETSYYLSAEELSAAVSGFDPLVRASVYSKLVEQMADALRKTAVGTHYTDITAPDTEGRPLALSSLVGPGRYVLLDFWASWCPPCRAEAPVMAAAYRKYHPWGFDIYAVSLDRTHAAWLKGIEELKLPWTHVSEVKFWDCPPAELYGVRSIPSNVLIGPDGIILARNLMGAELERRLSELIRIPRREIEPIPDSLGTEILPELQVESE